MYWQCGENDAVALHPVSHLA